MRVPLKSRARGSAKSRGVLADRERDARVVPSDYGQQHREVRHRARHRSMHRASAGMKTSRTSDGDAAERGAKAEHVVERGGIASEPRVIAAVGDGQHPQRERDGRAAAASAGGLRLIVGVERGAEDRIIGMRAEAEFRDVGFADDDRARALYPLDQDRIGAGIKSLRIGEPIVVRMPAVELEVLDSVRKPVHRAGVLAASKLERRGGAPPRSARREAESRRSR